MCDQTGGFCSFLDTSRPLRVLSQQQQNVRPFLDFWCGRLMHDTVYYIHLFFPSKIEWDLTNGPLSKLVEILDTQV